MVKNIFFGKSFRYNKLYFFQYFDAKFEQEKIVNSRVNFYKIATPNKALLRNSCTYYINIHDTNNTKQKTIIFSQRRQKLTFVLNFLSEKWLHVVAIPRCRVQCGKYFSSSSYFTSLQTSEIIAKYEKRGKYLPILHEGTCNKYFIVKCLLNSNAERVIFLTY